MSESLSFLQPFTSDEIAEKRRYVASRVARDHWGAGELGYVDHEARWLATIDQIIEQRDAAEEREMSCYAWAKAARKKGSGLPPSRALRWIDEMGDRIFAKIEGNDA
jgi:hypothetical protein